MRILGSRNQALGCGLALALAACASDPMPEVRSAYASGRYQFARDKLVELEEDDPSNAHIYEMEQSMTELALRDPKAAEQALQKARNSMDKFGGQSLTGALGSMLLDDRQLDYPGADYEHVLVRAMLAISNLMAGGGDAEAYSLQVLQRQLEIIHNFEDENTKGGNPKEKYKLVAFGSYLRGILNDDKPTRLGVAKEAFERVAELEPNCHLGQESLQRVTGGQHSEKGHGVVHVIALVGRGPFRVEVDAQVSQAAFAMAQIIWSLSRDRAVIPNITSVPIPALAFYRDNPAGVIVGVDGQDVAATEIVTDVNDTARVEFNAMHDAIVARAVLRRAFKIVVTEGAKEAVTSSSDYRRSSSSGDVWKDLAISLLGMLWTGSESADLRCWSLLPASFQAARIEMPAGDHEIRLQASINGRPVGNPQSVRVLVRDGFNTYVVVLSPTLQGGPPPMTSDPAEIPSTEPTEG